MDSNAALLMGFDLFLRFIQRTGQFVQAFGSWAR